ncbi:MAG: TolC family protein [Bacteroidales bacterium]
MKRRLIAFVIPAFIAAGQWVTAQEAPASLTLTVDQAVAYALDKNKSVASAKYDLLASEKAKWEAIAAGLPSIDASASFNNNLAVMTRIIDFNGVPTPIKFGTTYDDAYGVSASTLVFNAPWLVGMQTSRLAATLASQGLTQTRIETTESVINAYHLILTIQETIKVIDQNLANLNEVLASTQAMYSVGMAEATDVDQMQSNVSMLKNTRSSMERSLELNYNMLRFLLGVERGTVINLTDNLEGLVAGINVEALVADEFNLENNISYQLIESQLKMSELSVKGAKATAFPTLAGSIYYTKTGMGNKLGSMQYFPYSAVGLQLQVPILASGSRYAKIKKAEINYEKAQNTKSMVSDQLLLQEKQLRYNLLSANDQYKTQKENIDIAARVLKSIQNKYNQGMASSLDLTQANNNYLTAQSNYLNAAASLLQTKVAFDKLMNNL